MGISASQGKLLFMTARISNNEFQQQSIAFSKERLSDRASLVSNRYNEALNSTKYQILTGFNGVVANYEDLTYNMLTSYNSASSGRQYIVKNNKGKVLVPNELAKAFQSGNGDFNKFLKTMGYTQANVNVNNVDESKEAIHNAWDKYLVSVGQSIESVGDLEEHILGFGYKSFNTTDRFDGYPTYKTAVATAIANGQTFTESLYKNSQGYYTNNATITVKQNENGENVVCYQNPEQIGTNNYNKLTNITYNEETHKYTYNDNEYDVLYINPKNMKIGPDAKDYLELRGGSNYVSKSGIIYNVTTAEKALNYEGATKEQRELYDYALALTEAYEKGNSDLTYDAGMVNYYRNIFNEMMSCGYTTLAEADNKNDEIPPVVPDTTPVTETNFKDSQWFVNQLKSGKLTISYYSTASKGFLNTTLDDDEAIVEKEDKTKIAQAEADYNAQMDKIEHDEKMLDMQMNKLEAEHQALTTELESINKVIKDNIKESFKTFGNA